MQYYYFIKYNLKLPKLLYKLSILKLRYKKHKQNVKQII